MASTNKTNKLKLPQWLASDKPTREDLNDAFTKVEGLKNEVDDHKADYAILVNNFDRLFDPVIRVSGNYDDFPGGAVYASSSDTTNGPLGDRIVLTLIRSNTTAIQIAVSILSGDIKSRGKVGGTWSSWA